MPSPQSSNMPRGGLDRYLGAPASDASALPSPQPAQPEARELDCAGADANEPVCEIARAEAEERGEDSAT